MFVQVITCQTSDAGGLRRMMDRWVDELAAGAQGWLGSTAGVTDDGLFITLARFASREDAQRNSDRVEQGNWWAEFVKHLDGEPTFSNCSDAQLVLGGGSDEAGFVQVMQSTVSDRNEVRRAGEAFQKLDGMGRPDIIGGISALHDDEERLTQAFYFTSEAEARKGEQMQPPPEVLDAMQQWDRLLTDTVYYDLREPWLASVD